MAAENCDLNYNAGAAASSMPEKRHPAFLDIISTSYGGKISGMENVLLTNFSERSSNVIVGVVEPYG